MAHSIWVFLTPSERRNSKLTILMCLLCGSLAIVMPVAIGVSLAEISSQSESPSVVPLSLLWQLAAFVIVLALPSFVYWFARRLSVSTIQRLRRLMLDNVLGVSPSSLADTHLSAFLEVMTTDLAKIESFLGELCPRSLIAGTSAAICLVIIALNSILLCGFVTLCVFSLFILSASFAERSRKLAELERGARQSVLGTLQESFSGRETIYAFQAQKWRLDELGANEKLLSAALMKRELARMKLGWTTSAIIPIFCALIALFFLQDAERSEAISTIIACYGVFVFARTFALGASRLDTVRVSWSRVAEVLVLQNCVEVLQNCVEKNSSEISGNAIEASIRCQLGGLQFVDADFSLERKEIVAIIGKSGSGKTTIAKTLIGLLKCSGTVKFGLDSDGASLRLRYGFQNASIFSGTFASNIMLSSQYGDAREVLKQLGMCEEWYKRTDLVNFSGGELNRLSLARLIMARPDIAIFDEPTEALDQDTKRLVINAIESRSFFDCAVIITHDWQIARVASRILLLEDQKLTEISRNSAKKLLGVWKND